MTLKELLNRIDPCQNIKIQYKGDILYTGKCMYFGKSDHHSDIYVINILIVPSDTTIDLPYITICIDRSFD